MKDEDNSTKRIGEGGRGAGGLDSGETRTVGEY